MAEYSPIGELEKFNIKINKEILYKLIDRIGEKNFELSDEKLLEYVQELKMNKDELVELVKKLKDKLTPDERVKFAEKLLSAMPNIAGEAYLYTMFDLQLIDKVRDYLENSAKNEYTKFKYLLFLKDHGKNFDIDMFV